MDDYIVRMYRRKESSADKVTGIVEEVGKEDRKLFRTPDELWSILNPTEDNSPERRKKKHIRIRYGKE